MNESKRKAYLSAMGVPVHYPRVVLPGAAPSPNYEFDIDNPPAQGVGQSPPANDSEPVIKEAGKTGPSKKEPGRNEPRKDEPVREEPVDKPALDMECAKPDQVNKESRQPGLADVQDTRPVDIAEEQEQSTEPELRFSLRYYRIIPGLSVIDEVPVQKSRIPEAQKLLIDILKALEVQQTEKLAPEVFNWPLDPGLKTGSDSVAAARKALQGYLGMRQELDGFNQLLVFAGRLEEVIGVEAGRIQHSYPIGNADVLIHCTRSLHAMLSYPQLKREVWQTLQPLCGKLQQ